MNKTNDNRRILAVGEFEEIAAGIYLEGLAVDYERNIVWYSDVIGGGVHGVLPDGNRLTLNTERKWTGGLMLNQDGSVLSSGQGGIMWNNPETGASGWLVHEIDGEVINGINEMIPDGTGGIIFGTIDIASVIESKSPGPSSLYRLTAEREVLKLAHGINFANGFMMSADRQQLYCNDTFFCTWIFDVLPDVSLSNKRMLLSKEDVDGMALDAEGTLWITGFRSGFITRLKPDGSTLNPIETPAGAVTQVRFAGADMRDYYITAVPADGGDSLKEGVALTEKKSFLYRGRSDVAGMPILPARFALG